MTSEQIRRRIYSIDFLRGLVMMIMMIDHVRDFVHAGAQQSDPTNPETTTVAIFFTRWITHFCAPTFVFLSGLSIYLQRLNGKSNSDLCRLLWTRGLWLIFLEFTVIRFALTFNLDYASFFGLAQVIWVIGVSMIVMAALIYLPVRLVGGVALAVVLLHDILGRFQVPPQVAFSGQADLGQAIWLILHQIGIVNLYGGGAPVLLAYSLIPWVAVMAAGYAFGEIYAAESSVRVKRLYLVGISSCVLFVVLRYLNIYGDPAFWSQQSDGVKTFLSFLNTSKYPPSLLFLLMTLGPSIIILALTDKITGSPFWQKIPITFGSVPMFYYIPHMFYSHGIGLILTYVAGKDTAYQFSSILAFGTNAPPGHGFPLWVVYAAWIGGLVLLYPLCAWYAGLKKRHKHWFFSYI